MPGCHFVQEKTEKEKGAAMWMRPVFTVGVFFALAAPALAQQIACTLHTASSLDGQNSATAPYTEPATLITFSDAGVERISSSFCDNIINSGVSSEAIYASCYDRTGNIEVTMAVQRYTGEFTKLIAVNGARPFYTMAYGSCVIAQQRF